MDEVDLDVPEEQLATTQEVPRLRRAAGLVTAGVVLLACQQVLGPVANTWLFFGSAPVDDGAQSAFVVAYFAVFAVGLAVLAIGLFRFTAHVHVLAALAVARSTAARAISPEAG